MTKTFLMLLLIGSAVRLVVWAVHGIDLFPAETPSEAWTAICAGALSDISLALTWEHARPPLFGIRELIKCGLAPDVNPFRFDLLLVSIVDILAAAVVFHILTRLSVSRRLAIVCTIGWSINLIAWEYYRFASSHNHLNIAILTLLVYIAVRRVQQPGLGADAGFAAAAALLVTSYGPALIFVPLLALLTTPWRENFKRLALSLAVSLSLPALVFGAVGYKNYKTVGVFSTSTYLSLNMGQFGFISLGYENPEGRLDNLLPRLNSSPWWQWCFEHRRSDRSRENSALFGLQGLCVNFEDPKSVELGLQKARELNDKPFIQTLERDLAVAKEAPWAVLFAGQALSSVTEVQFNKTSRRLYAEVLKHDPLGILRTFLMANRSFFLWGPMMFDGVHHEPHLAVAPRHINWFATGMGGLLIASVVAGFGFTLAVLVRLLVAFWRQGVLGLGSIAGESIFVGGLILVFLVTATVMNGVSCCENGRQFQSMSVAPFIVGVFLLHQIAGKFSRRKTS